MALTNYTQLKSSIADFLNRDDLTAVIPTFIALAESQINRDLRHWQMEKRSSGQQDPGDQYMQLPNDWVETIRFHITDSGTKTLDLASMATMADLRTSNEDESGTPKYYAHIDGQIELYPTPSGTTNVELLYYGKIDALSDSNTTNWLLTEAPDVYLYGALVHSAPYLAEDERVGVWAQMYSASLAQLNKASEDAKYSGSGLRMKIKGLG